MAAKADTHIRARPPMTPPTMAPVLLGLAAGWGEVVAEDGEDVAGYAAGEELVVARVLAGEDEDDVEGVVVGVMNRWSVLGPAPQAMYEYV